MKTVFTTGEAADVCKVSQQTIIRSFDSGRLKGFRVPGSRFRRIPRDALIVFMKDNGIPPDQLNSGKCKILIVDEDPEIVEPLEDLLSSDGRFETKTADSGFDAGLITQEFRPDLILIDPSLHDIDEGKFFATLSKNASLENIRIVVMRHVQDPEDNARLANGKIHDVIMKPFNVQKMIETIARLLTI